jgi:hypothetical protein
MKSLRYLLPILALFIVTNVPGAIADSRKSVTVTNDTSYVMYEFFASDSDNAAWDESNNLLAGQSIAAGQTSTITVNDGLDTCTYDLMAVLYGSSEYAYQYQVNLCNGDSAHWDVISQ